MDFRLTLLLVFCQVNVITGSCPDGAYDFSPYGLCFKLFEDAPHNYADATTACATRGGIIARLKSAEIQQFVSQTFSSAYFWFGLADTDGDSVFTWEDGSDIVYTNWTIPPSVGQCTKFQNNGWETVPCTTTIFYLCEVPRDNPHSFGLLYQREASHLITDTNVYNSLLVLNHMTCTRMCQHDGVKCVAFTFEPNIRNTENCILYKRQYGLVSNSSETAFVYTLD